MPSASGFGVRTGVPHQYSPEAGRSMERCDSATPMRDLIEELDNAVVVLTMLPGMGDEEVVLFVVKPIRGSR